MIRQPASRLLIFVVLLVGFGACKDGGCGNKADTVPATADARVEQMTSHLPAGTDTVFIAADLKKMRNTLNVVKDRLPNTGIVEGMQQQVQRAFGIDLLDEQSWKTAGVAPDSTAVVAVYRSRLLFLMYVDNRQAFEKTLVEKAKSAFNIEAVTKTETVGPHTMKILSDDPQAQIAWLYQGKLALVSMPALSGAGAIADGSAKLVLGEVADAKKETSLWAKPGFQAFKDALITDYAISAYANPESGLQTAEAKKQMEQEPAAAAMADWIRKNVKFIGGGLRADDKKAEAKVYIGLEDGILKGIQAAKQPQGKANWDAYATDKVLLGGRLSLNTSMAYTLALAAMPEEQKRTLRRNFKGVGDSLGLDIEKDVIDQLAGHVGLFFYGLAGGNPMQLMTIRTPADASNMLGLMMVLKFQSKEAVDKLVAKIAENAGDRFSVRPFVNLPEDPNFKVVAPSTPGLGNFFVHGDTVAFATNAFGDEAMHKYLTNARDDQKLSGMDLNLGKDFATGESFTGLYFLSARAQDNLKSLLAMGGVGQILTAIEEASLVLDADERGGFAELTIDLTPAPAKPEAAPAPTK